MQTRIKTIGQLLSLVLIDLFVYYLCLYLAIFSGLNFQYLFNFEYIFSIGNLEWFNALAAYGMYGWWHPVLFIFVMRFEKLYLTRYPFWEECRIIFKAVFLTVILLLSFVMVLSWFIDILREIPGISFLYFWVYLVFLLPLGRFWGKKILYKIGLWKENVFIIGTGEKAVSTVRGLVRENNMGYSVTGFLDDNPENTGNKIKINDKEYDIFGSIRDFGNFVNRLHIGTIFISRDAGNQNEITKMINEIYRHNMKVVIIPDIAGSAYYNSDLQFLFSERLFIIKVNNNLNTLFNRMVKRIFDLIISSVGLIIISPFLFLIAAVIKITSPGKILYFHTRIGKNGRQFRAYKFRTMYQDAQQRLKTILEDSPEAKKEWETNYKLKNDPRITGPGKILREFSLDELPQIFNILKGEMSVVGPRPVIQEEIDKYYGDFRQYYYSVLPGLTGLWQVSGRSDTNYAFRVQSDVWYVQNWSLWLDIIILVKSFPTVLKRSGAY